MFCSWKASLTGHPDTILCSVKKSLCLFLVALCPLALPYSRSWSRTCDYSELYWCCKIGTVVPDADPLSGAQAPSLFSDGLEQQSLPGSSCEVRMPDIVLQTVLGRIVVQSSAKPEHEDSQEKGEGTGRRGRFKINSSHEIYVESRLTASLITNLYFGEETKPRLFLLRILFLLVIHFCSTLQNKWTKYCNVASQLSTCSIRLTALETETGFKGFLASPWPL